MKYVIPLLAFGLIMVPTIVDAQGSGLVTCGFTKSYDCNWCTLMLLVNNIITWLIMFLSIVAVIAIVIAGFKMVTSRGNTEAWTSAKSMFTNIVIGIVLVLAAWLIVDTVLSTLTGRGINEWLPKDCGGAAAKVITGTETETQNGTSIVASGNEAQVREQLKQMGYDVNKGDCGGKSYQQVSGGCTSVGGFTSGMLNSLSQLKSGCTNCGTLMITGGSEGGHQTHGDGNSVDLRFNPSLDSYIRSGGASRAGLNCDAESDHWHCRR